MVNAEYQNQTPAQKLNKNQSKTNTTKQQNKTKHSKQNMHV